MPFQTCAMLAAALMVGGTEAYAAQSSKQRAVAFARLPDWSGIWEFAFGPPADNVSGQSKSVDEQQAIKKIAEMLRPPFNPEWQAKYESLKLKATTTEVRACDKTNFPAVMSLPGMFELLVTPEEAVLLHTMMHRVRHIYTDGRDHPPSDELWPTPMGDSVGHWEGDTLVVSTVAMPKELLLVEPAPGGVTAVAVAMSDQLKISERIRRLDRDSLEVQMTVADNKALARPWQVTYRYLRVKDLDRLIDEDCENERNPVVNGKFTVTE
jgi:hypothetical protein